MKKFLFFFSLIIFFTTRLTTAQGIWTKMATFPGAARFLDAGFSIGHYGFIGVGEDNVYNSQYFDFYKWNQTTNKWSPIAYYPGTGACAPITAAIDGYGYVGLGFNVITQTGQQDLWKYDTTNNTWTQMASLPGPGRYDVSFFTMGHKIYVIGGSTGGPPYLDDAWVYDAHANTWTQLNSPPSAGTDNMVTFTMGNHAYLGGGWDGSFTHSDFWEYDTTSDTYTSIAAFPIGVEGDPRSFVICSKAYVCNSLGYNFRPIPVGCAYDTVTKGWAEFTNMGTNGIERGYTAGFTIGNYGYIGTGQDSFGNPLNDYWQYGDTSSTIIVTPSKPVICEGGSVTLKASGSPNYTWSPATGLSATTGDSVVADPIITTTYLASTSTNGCATGSNQSVVTVTPPPLVNIVPDSPTVCAGQGITLSVPDIGLNYVWSPVQSLSSSTGDTVVATPTIQTTYTVTGTDSIGCSATGTDVVSIIPAPDQPTLSQNDSILTTNATQGIQWSRNDTVLEGATTQNYTITVAGWYKVVVVNPANGCSATSDSMYFSPSGIFQLSTNGSQLSIYPNPSDGKINVASSKTIDELKVFNVLGQLIYEAQPKQTQFTFELKDEGVYFVTVAVGNESSIGKMVINR